MANQEEEENKSYIARIEVLLEFNWKLFTRHRCCSVCPRPSLHFAIGLPQTETEREDFLLGSTWVMRSLFANRKQKRIEYLIRFFFSVLLSCLCPKQVYHKELEKQPEFSGCCEWVDTYDLFKGKSLDDDEPDSSRMSAKFKGKFWLKFPDLGERCITSWVLSEEVIVPCNQTLFSQVKCWSTNWTNKMMIPSPCKVWGATRLSLNPSWNWRNSLHLPNQSKSMWGSTSSGWVTTWDSS